MTELHVLSWGGGTQSTALMLKFLNKQIKDNEGVPIVLDYIFFADTKNEPNIVYDQVYKIQKHVKEKYNQEIIITARNEELLSNEEAEKKIKNGTIENYRQSKYADLFQSHILYFKGHLKSIDAMPFYTRKPNGTVGKTPFKLCTITFKIDQIMKELRKQLGVGQIRKKKYKVNMYIGFSNDEIQRVKPTILPYAENKFPLVDLGMNKQDCIDYVENQLGFKPISSVCNMCYANDLERVYLIYKNDPDGWAKLLELDEAMRNKHKDHKLNESEIFMYKWQAQHNVRISDLDFEKFYQENKALIKTTIFDLEEELSCMGGCFI
jgi:hypothetical protein